MKSFSLNHKDYKLLTDRSVIAYLPKEIIDYEGHRWNFSQDDLEYWSNNKKADPGEVELIIDYLVKMLKGVRVKTGSNYARMLVIADDILSYYNRDENFDPVTTDLEPADIIKRYNDDRYRDVLNLR